MIETLWTHFFGYGVFIGLMYGIWKCNARRWTRLSRVYGAADTAGFASADCNGQRMQTVILTGGNVGWNSYKGIVTVLVTRDGILFQLMPPFSICHPPFLVPFRDIKVSPKRWYLFGKSFQLTFTGVSNVQIIVHEELIAWIERQTSKLVIEIEAEDRVGEDPIPEDHPSRNAEVLL